MSKITEITRITSEVLDKYRNSIPRKAFVQAMERVAEAVVTPGEIPNTGSSSGLEILRNSCASSAHIASMISGACPPFGEGCEDVKCDAQSCQSCWLAWLETGRPLQEAIEGAMAYERKNSVE